MNKLKILFLSLAVIGGGLVSSSSLWSDGGSIGTESMMFLEIAPTARSAGLAGAYSAAADEADALYWNPAALTQVDGKSAMFTHTDYLQNFLYDYVAYSQKVGLGTMAGSFTNFSSKKIESYDATGNAIGDFRIHETAFSLGYGLKVKEWNDKSIAAGIGYNWLRSSIVQSAQAHAFDMGMLYNHSAKARFSMVIKNLGTTVKYGNVGYDLPFTFKLGASYDLPWSMTANADLDFPRSNDPNINLGTEYSRSLMEDFSVALRAGYSSRTTNDVNGFTSFTLGTGLGWKDYDFNFAWVPFGDLGQTYRFGLSANWGK